MKNTIKKRIVALSLIGALCIPTAAYAYDGLSGKLYRYYDAPDEHYVWAEHEHYTVYARINANRDSGWQCGWGHVTTDHVSGISGTYYYKDSSAYHRVNF